MGIGSYSFGKEADQAEFRFRYDGEYGFGLAYERAVFDKFKVYSSLYYYTKLYYIETNETFFNGNNYFIPANIATTSNLRTEGFSFTLGIGYGWRFKQAEFVPLIEPKISFGHNYKGYNFTAKEMNSNDVLVLTSDARSVDPVFGILIGSRMNISLSRHLGIFLKNGFVIESGKYRYNAFFDHRLYEDTSKSFSFPVNMNSVIFSFGLTYGFGTESEVEVRI